MGDYPKQSTPMDTKDHPDVQKPDTSKIDWSKFGSTMLVGDYPMPRAGDLSLYKVKGKD